MIRSPLPDEHTLVSSARAFCFFLSSSASFSFCARASAFFRFFAAAFSALSALLLLLLLRCDRTAFVRADARLWMPTPNGHARPVDLGKERSDEGGGGEGDTEGGVGSCLFVDMGVGEEWWRTRPITVLVGELEWCT